MSPGRYSDLTREDEISLDSISGMLPSLFNREVLGSLPQYKQRNLLKSVRFIEQHLDAIWARHKNRDPETIPGDIVRPELAP